MTPDERTAYNREWMLERAAIIEYEANLPRAEAERLAVEQWYELRRIDPSWQSDET